MTKIMPSDAAIVALCAEIYRPSAIAGSFDHYDAGMDDGICWALKRLDGFDVVIFRGSVTLWDWLRDFRALATPSRIGHVHNGFHAGMEHMWADLKPLLSQPTIVAGHSLGAARADVLAALMTVDGVPPVARVVFGEPKPGLLDFARLIAGIAVAAIAMATARTTIWSPMCRSASRRSSTCIRRQPFLCARSRTPICLDDSARLHIIISSFMRSR